MNWKNITTVNITTASGEPDTIHFQANSEGGFRITNDYGNENITFDTMTGLEMMNRFSLALAGFIAAEIEKTSQAMSQESGDYYPDENDCQGDGV